MQVLLYIILLLLVINILLIIFQQRKKSFSEELIRKEMDRVEEALRKEERQNREDNAKWSKEQREELNRNINDFRESYLRSAKEQREELQLSFKHFSDDSARYHQTLQEDLARHFKQFQESFEKNTLSSIEAQKERFKQMDERQKELIQSTEKKLEEMRETVDEKLQKTLNERIGKSFELVGKQLESVQKGLGEMQNLASDVGGLKKVLSNVKVRGTYGEIQLQALLEQMLSPEQYESNVKTAHSGDDRVEFAIRLPGNEDDNSCVYLPIDAKFPKDVYEQYIDAVEKGDTSMVDEKSKLLESTLKKMAKDIHDKYIDPPQTTDFAILFLPFESIYAETIRRTELMEELRQKYKIAVAGPTTLGALLNSLQMGFRTLAIQKRSSQVWKTLGLVKTEFGKFGDMLKKAQKNIQLADKNLDDIIGTRTRAIERTLRSVEALPAGEDQKILDDFTNIDLDSETL